MDKILYVVYADTYEDSWGAVIEMFGVTDNENDLKKICETVKKDGYSAEVEEVTLNKYCNRCLGCYYE